MIASFRVNVTGLLSFILALLPLLRRLPFSLSVLGAAEQHDSDRAI